MSKGPVLIELEDQAPAQGPDTVPPVPDGMPPPQGQAMQTLAVLAARRPSRLVRWFWVLAVSLLGVVVSVTAWDFVTSLLVRAPVLGWGVTALLIGLAMVLLAIATRELAAFSRLKRIDTFKADAETALADRDLEKARRVVGRLSAFYASREDVRWGRDRLAERAADQFDAEGIMAVAEAELLTSLDQAALREVEAAARQVATVTAVVPLAFADVIAALTSNIRMIRRVAEIYGGRSGTLGSWRLTRAVMTHLVATGAVAIGDDLIGSVAGGSVLSKVSRRFGEGIVNGALTARVGVAAIEVCRPLPFVQAKRPSVTGLVKRALTGLFASR